MCTVHSINVCVHLSAPPPPSTGFSLPLHSAPASLVLWWGLVLVLVQPHSHLHQDQALVCFLVNLSPAASDPAPPLHCEVFAICEVCQRNGDQKSVSEMVTKTLWLFYPQRQSETTHLSNLTTVLPRTTIIGTTVDRKHDGRQPISRWQLRIYDSNRTTKRRNFAL